MFVPRGIIHDIPENKDKSGIVDWNILAFLLLLDTCKLLTVPSFFIQATNTIHLNNISAMLQSDSPIRIYNSSSETRRCPPIRIFVCR